ncbi:MAG: rhodanese-like domain-containing protein, partial [Bacteroidota bacterium]
MNGPIVSVDWLNENLGDPDLIILDGSVPKNVLGLTPKYVGVKIKNARKFDLKGAFSDQGSSLPNTMPSPEVFEQSAKDLGINQRSKIVVYDDIHVYSSPRAYWMFRAMGHDSVAVLDGGLPAWCDKSYAVEPIDTKTTYLTGDFVAQFDSSAMQNAEDLLKRIS